MSKKITIAFFKKKGIEMGMSIYRLWCCISDADTH